MAMRETVKTLRLYCIFVGTVGAFQALFLLQSSASSLVTLIGLGGLLFSLAWLYLGVMLKTVLTASLGTATSIIIGSMGWSILLFTSGLIYAAATGAAFEKLLIGLLESLVFCGLSILLFRYLLKNIKRLAAEQRMNSTNLPA
jgi:hypothetical protein